MSPILASPHVSKALKSLMVTPAPSQLAASAKNVGLMTTCPPHLNPTHPDLPSSSLEQFQKIAEAVSRPQSSHFIPNKA